MGLTQQLVSLSVEGHLDTDTERRRSVMTDRGRDAATHEGHQSRAASRHAQEGVQWL